MNKTKKRKKRNGKIQKKHIHTNNSHLPEWRKIYYNATQGYYTEEERAIVAVKAAMMDAMRTFNLNLPKYMKKCNTNLGLMLQTEDSIEENSVLSSLMLRDSEKKGKTEYVPVKLKTKLTIQLGNLDETLDEHIESLIELGGNKENVTKEFSSKGKIQGEDHE